MRNAPAKPGITARKPARPAPTRRRERVHQGVPELEQQADRIATNAMACGAALFGTPLPLTPRTSLSSAPKAAQRALRETGQPLDRATREFMESRLGYDFSGIRIHDGPQAARSAGALGAHAFAAGDRIVFDAGQYRPHDAQGRWLLAHELAHIVQQAQGAAPAILHKGKPGTKEPIKFYEEVRAAIEDQEKKIAKDGPFFTPQSYPTNKALLDLAKAVDEGRIGDIHMLTQTLIKTGYSILAAVSEDLIVELAARMYELGQEADAAALRKSYHEDYKEFPISNWDLGLSRRNVNIFTRQIDIAAATIDLSSGDAIRASLTLLAHAMGPLRDAFLVIDLKALREEDADRTFNPFQMILRPDMFRREYYDALEDQIQRVIGILETVIQTVMDAAIQELQDGQSSGGDKLQLLHGWLEQEFVPLIEVARGGKNLAIVPVRIIHADFQGAGRGTISDAFPAAKGKSKTKVEFNAYDPKQLGVADQRATIGLLSRTRLAQIDVLARLYGVQDVVRQNSQSHGDAMENAEDADSNQRAIAATPRHKLRLNSDDDWRQFVIAKLDDLVHPQPGQARLKKSEDLALQAVVETLFSYLRAFTVHVHAVNLYDFGPTYLNRPFPRALSGQIVHDCGVYAVRVAYILSLVRDRLKLNFHFVLLPAHIALVMEKPGLSAYIFQNDSFERIAPDSLEMERKNFDAFAVEDADKASKNRAARLRSTKDDRQFFAELTAALYVPAPVDMPYRMFDVPAGASQLDLQNKLWQIYQQNAKPEKDVFGKASHDQKDPDRNFHLRFLGLTEQMRAAFNQFLLPLWNETGPELWDAFVTQMRAAKSPTASDLIAMANSYDKQFAALVKPYEKSRDEIFAAAEAITKQLANRPELISSVAGLTNGWRAFNMLKSDAIEDYREQLRDAMPVIRALVAPVDIRRVIDPATAGDPLNLYPPFIPRDKKRRNPVE